LTATFFGHPRGLATLFFTEMWERFTYYGMRAVLVLFLVAAVAGGGFGIDDRTATAIYGLYTAGVYLAALPGGWIADRLIGAQHAVLAGGLAITFGNTLLALSTHCQCHRRGPVSGRRRTARCRIHAVLHRHQHRRVARAAGHRLGPAVFRTARRIRGGCAVHGRRRAAVLPDAAVPRSRRRLRRRGGRTP
jgi:dipeptide/tripeptide permease